MHPIFHNNNCHKLPAEIMCAFHNNQAHINMRMYAGNQDNHAKSVIILGICGVKQLPIYCKAHRYSVPEII